MASESKTTARALLARNPVTFESLHGVEESIALLAKATGHSYLNPYSKPDGDVDPRFYNESLRGTVTNEVVILRFGPTGSDASSRTHFHGRWESDLKGVRLVGEVRPGGSSRTLMSIMSLWMAACLGGGLALGFTMGWTDPLAITALIAGGVGLFIFPVVVVGMGSSRIAREIEIVRAIGSAIGDPQKYAKPRWKRWKDE